MNDLDICKRIAEIEGLKISREIPVCVINPESSIQYFKEKVYNPLTDDGLCFRLIEKYRVSINWENKTVWIGSHYIEWDKNTDIDTVKKAACVIIIEANKDK